MIARSVSFRAIRPRKPIEVGSSISSLKLGSTGFKLSIRANSQYNYNQPYNASFDQQQQQQNQQQHQQQKHHYYQLPPKTSTVSKIIRSLVIFGVLTGFSYYMWWPKHTFPSSVAKILRKGLWAESDRGDYDYKLALKYYLQALNHCNEIRLDPLSDEYTGIQLKIGEMFEILNMKSDAAFIYNEIATLYLAVLTAPKNSPESKRIRNVNHRRHLIKKDLRIALKLAVMNQDDPVLAKSILMTHLIIAQDEINRHPAYDSSLHKYIAKFDENSPSISSLHTIIDKDSIIVSQDKTSARFLKSPEPWEPFADEFFSSMDYLSVLCIGSGDIGMAIRVKLSNTEAMLMADQDLDKIILSQCNLGSLLYLQSGQFEDQEYKIKKRFANQCDIDYKKLLPRTLFKSQDASDDIDIKLNETITPEEKNEYKAILEGKQKSLNFALALYESVITFSKNLPQDVVKNNNNINETAALATYGLGVVNLNLRNYEAAERYLREARVRSKNCGYHELLENIETELKKVFKEQESSKLGLDESDKPSGMNIDVHLVSYNK